MSTTSKHKDHISSVSLECPFWVYKLPSDKTILLLAKYKMTNGKMFTKLNNWIILFSHKTGEHPIWIINRILSHFVNIWPRKYVQCHKWLAASAENSDACHPGPVHLLLGWHGDTNSTYIKKYRRPMVCLHFISSCFHSYSLSLYRSAPQRTHGCLSLLMSHGGGAAPSA